MRIRRWCIFVCGLWYWTYASASQRPACNPTYGARCVALDEGNDEYDYQIDGEHHSISFKDSAFFRIQCGTKVTLDNEAYPRFTDEARVTNVYLIDCAPPKESYAHVLRTLNVVALQKLTISKARDVVSDRHLAGLEMSSLALVNLHLAPDAFETFNFTNLRFDAVSLPTSSSIIDHLPISVKNLHLAQMGVSILNRTHLDRLPALTKLTVRDEGNISVEASESLTEITLQADAVRLGPALPDKLASVTLDGWAELAPAPWKSCSALKKLDIDTTLTQTLPDNWLVNCKSLRELSLKNAFKLKSLNSTSVLNAHALRGLEVLERVTFKDCGLEKLPTGLLDNTVLLSYLNLSGNRLKDLPNGLFGNTKKLEVLDLSYNDLTNDAFYKLQALWSLHELRLDGNERLGDACPSSKGVSLLQDLKSLRQLNLSITGAKVICRDFIENMALLTNLDLRNNNFTQLTFQDVQFGADTTVDLTGNNITGLVFTWDEYRLVAADREAYCSGATYVLSSALSCDCRLAWAARALRLCGARSRLGAARCGAPAGHALAGAPPDALACAVPRAQCPAPAACACAWRWREAPSSASAPERVLRVDCSGAGLRAPPALGELGDVRLELVLARNSLAGLRRHQLPRDLLALDLRETEATVLDPELVTSLPADGRLWLANNSLSCECDNAAALAALLARPAVLQDAGALRCAGGGPLRLPQCARLRPALAGALGGAALLALALGAALVRRDVRARLKALLRGAAGGAGEGAGEGAPAGDEADDEACSYDVFVSHSHRDAAVVAALLAWLEPRYRVCVHFRDWAPGGWIPAQIAASVRRSRRTLAVVSAHFLASGWARAEFREAHALALRSAAPRLLVVLLAEPAQLPLDAELRRFLAANTYVRWGDAWFWDKLQAALPEPRPPAPAPPVAAEELAGAAA